MERWIDFSGGLPPAASLPSVGIRPEWMLDFLRMLRDGSYCLHGMQIIRRGKLCFSYMAAPYTLDTPHRVYSSAKSVYMLGVLLAMQDGLLTEDSLIAPHFTDYLPDNHDPRWDRMTVSHLLTMSVGQTEDAFPAILTDLDANLTRLFFSTPFTEEPGAVYRYNNTVPTVLCDLLTRVTGRPVEEYLRERLLEPMDAYLFAPCQSRGNWNPVVTSLTARSFLKLASLFYNEGRWGDAQLVDRDLLRRATANRMDTGGGGNSAGYGWQVWMNAFGGYRMDGGWGQCSVILPEEELVCNILSDMPDYTLFFQAFEQHLLPALTRDTLPEHPVAVGRMAGVLDDMGLSPKGKASSARHGVGCVCCGCDGGRRLSVAIRPDCVEITLEEGGGASVWRSGIGGVWQDNGAHLLVTPEQTVDNGVFDGPKEACLMSAAWADDDTLEIISRGFGALGHYRYTLHIAEASLLLAVPAQVIRAWDPPRSTILRFERGIAE